MYLSCTHSFFLSRELGTAYVSATTGAVATALGLNALTKVLCFDVSFLLTWLDLSGSIILPKGDKAT